MMCFSRIRAINYVPHYAITEVTTLLNVVQCLVLLLEHSNPSMNS